MEAATGVLTCEDGKNGLQLFVNQGGGDRLGPLVVWGDMLGPLVLWGDMLGPLVLWGDMLGPLVIWGDRLGTFSALGRPAGTFSALGRQAGTSSALGLMGAEMQLVTYPCGSREGIPFSLLLRPGDKGEHSERGEQHLHIRRPEMAHLLLTCSSPRVAPNVNRTPG